MSKMEKIKIVAVKMTVAQLKNECAILSEKLSKITKADRALSQYTEGMAAWKIMRLAITEKLNG